MPHVIASLVANVAALGGLVFLGWSIWMAVAVYWLENAISLPVLAVRVRRAFPLLTDEQLEAYLAARDQESTGGVSEGRRLRAVLAERGRAGAARYAARRLVLFYGAFAAAHGLFVFIFGIFSTAIATDDPEAVPDLAVFDWPALLLAGVVILGAELLGLRLDRRPLMPDVGAYTGRMIVLHVTIVLGAFALTLLGATAVAVLFVALKTAADLRVMAQARRAAPGTARVS